MSSESGWDCHYRWEWFHREQWLPRFRERKHSSPLAFSKLVEETGGDLVLDASCGFGLKTIVMEELGLNVVGCDGCEYAVERARELAASEGVDIEFFVSPWSEIPSRTAHRFDGIFNDALSWTTSREEFEASLNGFLGALKPGGIFVFMGAAKGSPSDPGTRQKLLDELWESRPRFSVEWSFSEGDTKCSSILAREKGDLYVDEHHVYLIEEAGAQRIETASVRQPLYWNSAVLEELFDAAGFSSFETRQFEGMGLGGRTFSLNVATK